ncbi:hypothetical protein Tco_1111249, partial [Tanacetum coccineum]
LMALSIADQIALDDALVAPADRLKIGKFTLRLQAFQVTADAPEIFMQEIDTSSGLEHSGTFLYLPLKSSPVFLKLYSCGVRNETTQLYGAILPVALTNEDIRNSESYKEYYARASGTIPPKTKGSKKKATTDIITQQKPPTAPKEKKSGKGKQKTTELENISEADLTEAEQLKIVTKRSRQETHSSHASGSGADEGTGVTPGVPDAPDYDSEDDISWKSSDDDQDDEQVSRLIRNDVEGANVASAKSDEDATDEKDQGNEAVKDINTDLDGRDKSIADVEDHSCDLTPVNHDVSTTTVRPIIWIRSKLAESKP